MNYKTILCLSIIGILLATSAPVLFSESADAESSTDPAISDAGFIEDQKAFFYYSKFATSGFDYTGGSVSGDTPTKGVGKTMQNDSVFASVNKLDTKTQYYLTISEYSASDSLNYGISVTLPSSVVKAFVYMSIGDGIPYSDGTALTYTAISDSANTSFSTTPSDSIEYRLGLSTNSSGSNTVDETTIESPLEYSAIASVTYKTVEIEDDGVANIGKNYGYMSTGNAQYAGAALAYDMNSYVCIFFVTNIDAGDVVLKISNGSDYTVPTNEISFGKNVETGYAYAIIDDDTLISAGLDSDLENVSVSLGDGSNIYSTYSSSDDDNDDGVDSGVVIAVVLVIIIVVVGVVAIMKLTKKV